MRVIKNTLVLHAQPRKRADGEESAGIQLPGAFAPAGQPVMLSPYEGVQAGKISIRTPQCVGRFGVGFRLTTDFGKWRRQRRRRQWKQMISVAQNERALMSGDSESAAPQFA